MRFSLQCWGDLDGAMALQRERVCVYRELGDKNGLSILLGNQAGVLFDHGNLDEAMALCKEQERICRDRGSKGRISRSLGDQATILYVHRGSADDVAGQALA